MKLATIAFLFVTYLIAPWVEAADAPSKPGAEMEKFSIFIGRWKVDEEDEATPFGPAGKASAESEIRFIYNGLFVEERVNGLVAGQPLSETIVYYYDTSAHTYRSFVYDSTGTAFLADGTFEGRTWTTRWTRELNGKTYKARGISVMAPDGKQFTCEWSYSEDSGVTWKRMWKSTVTKLSGGQVQEPKRGEEPKEVGK